MSSFVGEIVIYLFVSFLQLLMNETGVDTKKEPISPKHIETTLEGAHWL